jgi:hypothetical protein
MWDPSRGRQNSQRPGSTCEKRKKEKEKKQLSTPSQQGQLLAPVQQGSLSFFYFRHEKNASSFSFFPRKMNPKLSLK